MTTLETDDRGTLERTPGSPPVTTEPFEHHDPLGRRDYISIEHVERYRFAAARLTPGARVLDIACGAGYGAAMLAARGAAVTGADYDPRAVELAKARFPGVEFTTADALRLPFEDESFDAVVTFETIEHVHDGRGFLDEMKRVLRPGGTLICSTPNVAWTAHPDYHVHEYEPEEFFALVERELGNVERHAQYFRPRDRIRDLLCWHVKPHVLRAVDLFRARPLLRRLLGREPVVEGAPPRPAGDRIRSVLDGPPDPTHRVRPCVGTDMLRIMIAVAREEGSA